MHVAAALALSYVSGSLPSAYLAGRWRGVDLRTQGSGNLGATNVLRVLGARVGAVVFAADIAKGALPIMVLAPLTGASGDSRTLVEVACGVAAVLGHSRPVFLGFRTGGKGVATACGVFLALAPVQAAIALLAFVVVVLASGYVSLASLTGAAALPFVLAADVGARSPLFAVGVLTLAFVTWTHRANIRRLRAGAEYRFERAAHLGVVPAAALGWAVIALGTAWLAWRAG